MGKKDKLFKLIMIFDCYFSIGTSSKKMKEMFEDLEERPSESINVNGAANKIYFLEEIIMEILVRLPVSSLVRFKCVSKYWKTLITSDYFIAKHCNHAKNNKKFLIAQSVPGADSYLYYCYSLSSDQPLQKLGGFPSNRRKRNYEILCCCNGLCLLWCREGYLLWNPSINESIQLPNISANSTYKEAYFAIYGMGYDSISDDYKILKIDNDNTDSKILALKSGSWRKIDKHPRVFRNHDYPFRRTYGALVNRGDSLAFVHSAFHWISEDNLRKYFIISFNISNEVYEEMSLPEGIHNIPNMKCIRRGISAIQGMLFAHCTCINWAVSTFTLWMMKDYGVEESWTGLFTIPDGPILLACVIPKYIFADGQMLLMYTCPHHRGFLTFKGPPFEIMFPVGFGPNEQVFLYFAPYELLPEDFEEFEQGFLYSESLISPKLLI